MLLVSGPTHGTLDYFNDNGTFSYTPEAGFSGSDSFVYRSAEYNRPFGDGELNPDRATVTILVGGSIDTAAPTAVGESYDTLEDVVFKADVAHGVLANDVSPTGNTLVAELVSQAQYGRVILSPYGNFRYEPATSYYDGAPLNLNGPDAFTYRVWDGSKVSAPVAVVLNVLPVADVPRAPDVYDYTSQTYGYQPQGNVTGYGAGTPDRDGAASAVNGLAESVGVFVQGQYGRFSSTPAAPMSTSRISHWPWCVQPSRATRWKTSSPTPGPTARARPPGLITLVSRGWTMRRSAWPTSTTPRRTRH